MFTFPQISGNKTFAGGTLAALYGALSEWGDSIEIGGQPITDLGEPSMGFVLVAVGLLAIFLRQGIKKLEK